MSRLYAFLIWLLDPDRLFGLTLALVVLGILALTIRHMFFPA